jgi:hypothetical protein
MTIIGLPRPGDGSPYDAVDWDAINDEYEKRVAEGEVNILGRSKALFLLGEGGPYDGKEITMPPGASEILLPAAFGEGDMHGMVIYRREVRASGDRMVYIGQPEQPDPEDEEDDV